MFSTNSFKDQENVILSELGLAKFTSQPQIVARCKKVNGYGKPDFARIFLGDKTPCQAFEKVPLKNLPKIVITEILINARVTDGSDTAIRNALFNSGCEVAVLPKGGKDFISAASPEMLSQILRDTKLGSEAEARSLLQQQGKSQKENLVVGFRTYSNLRYRLRAPNNSISHSMASLADVLKNMFPTESELVTVSSNLPDLPDLEELEISDCDALQKIDPAVSNKLKKISVMSCKKLSDLALSNLPDLEELEISNCDALQKIDPAVCNKLKKLSVMSCKKLSDMPLSNLPDLEELEISNCDALQKIDPAVCNKLKKLSVTSCKKLSDMTLSNLPDLEELEISDCDALQKIDPAVCNKLKKIRVTSCKKLSDLALSNLPDLEELEISNCDALQKIDPAVSNKLKKISVMSCKKLSDLALSNLPDLEELTISSYAALQKIDPAVSNKLKKLSVMSCEKLHMTLSDLPDLEKLTIAYCAALQKIDLAVSNKLKKLSVMSCKKLSDLALSNLPDLEELEISGCDIKLLNLVNFPYLKIITICCSSLKKITLQNCQHLRKIAIVSSSADPILETTNCPELVEIDKKNHLSSKLNMPVSAISRKITPLTYENTLGIDDNRPNCPGAKKICSYNGAIYHEGVAASCPYEILISSYNKFDAKAQQMVFNPDNECLQPLSFPPANEIGANTVKELLTKFNTDKNHSVAYWEIEINPDNNIVPLPELAIGAKIIELYYSTKNGVELLIDTKTGRHYLKIQAGKSISTLTCAYVLENSPNFRAEQKNTFVNLIPKLITTTGKLLNTSDLEKLNNICAGSLSFLYEGWDINEKITLLINFFSKFKDEKIEASSGDFWILAKSALEQKRGVCRHRSLLFYLILHEILHLDSQLHGNGQHVFVSCKDSDGTFKCLDFLGGGEFPAATSSEAVKNFSLRDAGKFKKRTEICRITGSYEIGYDLSSGNFNFIRVTGGNVNQPITAKTIKINGCNVVKDELDDSRKQLLDRFKASITTPVTTQNITSDLPLTFWRQMECCSINVGANYKNDIVLLQDCLKQNAIFGAQNELYHQSILMVTLYAAGYKPNLVITEEGAYVEILCQLYSNQTWVPANKIFPDLQTQPTPSSSSSSSQSSNSDTKTTSLFEKYMHKSQINAPEELFKSDVKTNSLLILDNAQDPLAANSAILNYLKDEKKFEEHILINSPQEFETCWEILDVHNSTVTRRDGQLSRIAALNGGVIVVNCNNFSSNDIAIIHSVIDKIPMLHGKQVAAKVIMLITDTKIQELRKEDPDNMVSFFSRVCGMKISDKFLSHAVTTKQLPTITNNLVSTSTTRTEITIDLCGAYDWETRLFGEIEPNGDKIELTKGQLVPANKIIFLNPPHDVKFEVFAKLLQSQGKAFNPFSQQWLIMPENCSIEVLKQPASLTVLQNCTMLHEINNDKNTYNKVACLNIADHYLFIKQLSITADKKAKYTAGLLEEYANAYQSGDVIYVTESIPATIWNVIVAEIKKSKYSGKHFNFLLAPGVEIENTAKNDTKIQVTTVAADKFKIPNTSAVCVSNDRDLLACSIYRAKCEKLGKDNVVLLNVSSQSTYADLVSKFEYQLKQNEQDVTCEFSVAEQALINDLNKGKTVILNINISTGLYQNLLARINDNKKKGKLILVLPDDSVDKLAITNCTHVKFDFTCYKTIVGAAYADVVNFQKLEKFYQLVKTHVLHHGDKMPEIFSLSWSRIEACLIALREQELFHKQNPLKHILQYDYYKSSEEYAFLNILAKQVFADKLRGDSYSQYNDEGYMRKNALIMLINDNNVNGKNVEQYAYRILNCFDRRFIDKYLHIDGSRPADKNHQLPKVSDELLDKLKKIAEEFKYKSMDVESEDNQEKRIVNLMNRADTKMLFLKGNPGVGKSHIAEKLAKTRNDLVIIDEANLKENGEMPEGKYDEFKDQIFSKTVKDNKKIIFIGNPEHFPNRFRDSFFKDYAKTFWMKESNGKTLKDEIILPILRSGKLTIAKDVEEKIANQLLAIYKIMRKFSIKSISKRDLESLTQRLVMLVQDNRTTPEDLTCPLFRAAICEFAYGIENVNRRSEFILQVQNILSYEPVNPANAVQSAPKTTVLKDGYIVPHGHLELLNILEQNLRLRDLSKGNAIKYKKITLLEGSSGVGKSTFALSVLNNNNYKKIALDSNQNLINDHCYFEISGFGEQEKKIALEAAKKGLVLVWHEFNLDSQNEKFVIDLTSKAEQGFLIIASQNPGRNTTSGTISSRSHYLHFDDYTENEYKEIVKTKVGTEKGEKLLSAFFKARSVAPHEICSRTLFEALALV